MVNDNGPETTAESDAGETLSKSECMELLSSKRRETVLTQMATSEDRAHTLESLATAISQTEEESDLAAMPSERVCLSLHHVHLPKLDDAGVVVYDTELKTVEYNGDSQIEQFLDKDDQ